jgi:hypothetical protein
MLDIGRGDLLQRIEVRRAIVAAGVSPPAGLAPAAGKREMGAIFGGLEADYFFSHMNSQMGSPLGMSLVRTHLYWGLMTSAMPSQMGWKA